MIARLTLGAGIGAAIALAFWIAGANGWLSSLAALIVAIAIGLPPSSSTPTRCAGGGS